MTVQYSYNSDTGGMCDSTVQYSTVQYSIAIILTLGGCVTVQYSYNSDTGGVCDSTVQL